MPSQSVCAESQYVLKVGKAGQRVGAAAWGNKSYGSGGVEMRWEEEKNKKRLVSHMVG